MAKRRYALTHDAPGREDRYFIDALDPAQWTLTSGDDWQTRWQIGMPPPATFASITGARSINHIPGNHCLTTKSGLAETLDGLTRRLAASHGASAAITRRSRFTPATFVMPADRDRLLAEAAADPARLWLQKPANAARGEGIRVLRDPAEAPAGRGWLVQHYLAEPHLIDGRKYVLRLYALISGLEPLRVYLYREGFAKLASHRYHLDDLTDAFIHQTNPTLNATNRAVADPVVFIPLADYRERLRAEGRDPAALFRRLAEIVATTLIAGREPMRRATLASGADPRGCYEFLGLDCLIDTAMTPWLLECNLNPSLTVCCADADGGLAEGRIKRAMARDMVNLRGLNAPDRPTASASSSAAELARAVAAEEAAAGGFERLFPASDGSAYLDVLPAPRPADWRLAGELAGRRLTAPAFAPWQVEEHFRGDSLRLFATAHEQWLAPNPSATLIWLHASEGRPADAIVEALLALPGAGPRASVEYEVLTCLADWARAGLLRPLAGSPAPH